MIASALALAEREVREGNYGHDDPHRERSKDNPVAMPDLRHHMNRMGKSGCGGKNEERS